MFKRFVGQPGKTIKLDTARLTSVSHLLLPKETQTAELRSMNRVQPAFPQIEKFIRSTSYAFLAAAILAAGCDKGPGGKTLERIEQSVSRLTKQIEDQAKEISELKKQMIATPVESKSRREAVIITDPVERLKSQMATFASAFEASSHSLTGTWAGSVASYDIRKTDSIVTPLYGTLVINEDEKSNPRSGVRFTASFALQENEWILKALKLAVYVRIDKIQTKDEITQVVSISDPADSGYSFSQFLQAHFR